MVVIESYCRQCGSVCLPTDATCAACGTSLKTTIPLDDEVALPPAALRLTGHLRSQQLFHERYQIVRQLGIGGFGAVYEAEDRVESRSVAIKEIGLAGLNAQQTIEATGSFNREVQMLSSLRHPSIPRMYEQLTDAEHWYLIMEFISGETLEEILGRTNDGRLPLERVLQIGERICGVLGYLHSQQPAVIFRDIKPANIMITPQGKLYLIDFGVARLYTPGKPRDTIAFGSPGYASPEQYGRAQTTARADIYSLGALLHQMLTGSDPSLDPFHFKPLRECDRSLPYALEKLITRMLAEDREQRPASMSEVSSKLKAIASSPNVLQRQKAALQQKSASVSASVAFPVFSTIGVPVFIYRGHAEPIKTLAWSPDGSAIASLDRSLHLHIWDAFRSSSPKIASSRLERALDLAWSPDGRVLALADDDHVVRLWRLHARAGRWRMIALALGYLSETYEGHTGPVETLCWSPDGQMIASAETKGAIQIWNAHTRACMLAYQGHTEMIEDITWSPDGTRIASCSIEQTVRVWQASDGNGRWKWHLKGGIIVHTLGWSPDSCYLACGASDRAVYVWDLVSNHKAYVYRGHKGSVKSLAWSPDGQRIASASADGTVHVWSARDGHNVYIYRGHEGNIAAVAWSPDGQHLASAGKDTDVHVWKAT